jgi:hypothetical protein
MYCVGLGCPPPFVITARTSVSVLSLLSVWHSTMAATPSGRTASMVIFSRGLPEEEIPCPRLMAFSMESFGYLAALALSMAVLRREFAPGSGPYTELGLLVIIFGTDL